MATPRFKIADIDEKTLARIKQMEESLGLVILALTPDHPFAKLTDEQVSQIKALEESLGVYLLAYSR